MEQQGICFIAGAMPLEETFIPRLEEDDLLIAADGGFEHLCRFGLTPHLTVGDFDSLGHVPDCQNLHVLPREKDDTDTGYAIRLGLERGYRRFLLLGGMGGRLDHTIANLQQLRFLAEQGAKALLAGEGQAAAVLINGTFCFPETSRGYCSVFALDGRAEGVSLRGLKYTLEGAVLTGALPIGVSNEFLGVPAAVTVERGTLLLIWEQKDGVEGFLRD